MTQLINGAYALSPPPPHGSSKCTVSYKKIGPKKVTNKASIPLPKKEQENDKLAWPRMEFFVVVIGNGCKLINLAPSSECRPVTEVQCQSPEICCVAILV